MFKKLKTLADSITHFKFLQVFLAFLNIFIFSNAPKAIKPFLCRVEWHSMFAHYDFRPTKLNQTWLALFQLHERPYDRSGAVLFVLTHCFINWPELIVKQPEMDDGGDQQTDHFAISVYWNSLLTEPPLCPCMHIYARYPVLLEGVFWRDEIFVVVWNKVLSAHTQARTFMYGLVVVR